MGEKKPKSFFKDDILQRAGHIALIIAILFLVSYLFFVMNSSSDFYSDSAEKTAFRNFEADVELSELAAGEHYHNLYSVADRLKNASSVREVTDILGEYRENESMLFGDLRYISDGKIYSVIGTGIDEEHSGEEQIKALLASGKVGVSDPYIDTMLGSNCVAFFVPLSIAADVDGLVSIMQTKDIVNAQLLKRESSVAALILDKNARILSQASSLSFGNDFKDYLYDFAADKADYAAFKSKLESGERFSYIMKSVGDEYVFSVSPISTLDGRYFVVSIDEAGGLIAPEMLYIRHIINVSVIAIIALAVGLIYAFCYYRETKKTLTAVASTDITIGCPNLDNFKKRSSELLRDRENKYAVAVFEIRQFRIIKEQYGEAEATETLRFIAKVLETFNAPRETFCYIGGSKFAVLIHCASNRSVTEKLRIIETVAQKHNILGESRSKRKFNFGISEQAEQKRYTVSELLDNAEVALKKARTDVNTPVVTHTAELANERDRSEHIEAEMESALANGEFRLFLQPKYNVSFDRVDSAEALVRWFDPKTGDYRFPGEFIGLFETNGFITKLDHFMYLETLKFLSAAAERGEKVVPISVNVSLVTVSAPDFLDFYVENKKKYMIADDFVTIEFTESFAMGDYSKICEIVNTLHENGIRCSLDDFGSGYSSLGALKNIPLDELKLDRLFLAKGFDKKNDKAVLETTINLARSLGVRVVQEGVETKEMFDMMVALGCDVIQGYYYAKAISKEEYRLFVNSNTSIKYKSLVK